MLEAYRWLQLSSLDLPASSDIGTNSNGDGNGNGSGNSNNPDDQERLLPLANEQQDYLNEDQQASSSSRRQLANRLNKLAKLGGKHSRQLLDSLRSALEMDPKWLEFTRFRALRLIRPTTQLNGRFTCSVSSLEGDDLKSKQLVVYGKYSSLCVCLSVERATNISLISFLVLSFFLSFFGWKLKNQLAAERNN